LLLPPVFFQVDLLLETRARLSSVPLNVSGSKASLGLYPCTAVLIPLILATFREGNGTVGTKGTDNIPVSYIANFPGLAENVSTNHGPFLTLVTTTDGK
jgi:hypothetical protein